MADPKLAFKSAADELARVAGLLYPRNDEVARALNGYWRTRNQEAEVEDCDERVARLRAAATDVRLRDAQTVGDLLDDAREALEAAYGELERAEEHHRWHHEQEGREVELDDERLRVLMVIAEALDSLGAGSVTASKVALESEVTVSPMTYHRLRLIALARDCTIEAALEEAIREFETWRAEVRGA